MGYACICILKWQEVNLITAQYCGVSAHNTLAYKLNCKYYTIGFCFSTE